MSDSDPGAPISGEIRREAAPGSGDAAKAAADEDSDPTSLDMRSPPPVVAGTPPSSQKRDEKPLSRSKARKQAFLEKAQAFVGRVLSDRYGVDEVLAVGGMGCVYRGHHVHMRKRVAIKVLLPDTEGLPDLVMRFEREAIAGAHIDHPNVAAATDFGRLEDGSYFLILQYIRGITLHDLIKQGPVPPVRAVRIARQLAAALDAAHQMGVIHRDIKPRNIMLQEGRNDFVKLIDFGLAKVPMDRISAVGVSAIEARKPAQVTGMGVVFGTISYMAPEAAFGMAAVNERSDLYAFGVILYEMLAGAHPFDATDPSEVFRMHRTTMPPPIRVRSPGVEVAPRLEAVAMRLLQKDPADRFESARAVIAALDAAMPSAALDIGGPMISASPQVRLAGSVSPEATPVAAPGADAKAKASPAPGDGKAKAAPLDTPVGESAGATQGGAATSAPPVEEYVPRLAARPLPSSGGAAGTPRWAIGAAIAISFAAALTTAFLLRQSQRSGSGAAEGAEPVGAAGAIAEAAGAAGRAAESAAKAEEAESNAEVRALREKLRSAADGKEWGRGATAFLALAEVSPASFADRDVAVASVAVAAGLDLGDARSEKIFEVMSGRLGERGLSILFDIVSTRGGSKAAARAAEILRQPDVLEKASPALRIAIELREAPCKDKLSLLDRAKTDGDIRAIAFLDILRSDDCRPRMGQCCFRQNPEVEGTIHAIRARLRKPH